MQEGYQKLFAKLPTVKAEPALAGRIVARIRIEERKQARRRVWIFGTSTVAAFSAIVGLGTYVAASFAQSGFYDYLSLAFSGGGLALYWKELSLSLIESLPIVGVITLLGAVVFFVWSSSNTFSSARRFIQVV